MAIKTHMQRIIERKDLTITTTLCNRLANSHHEINSTDQETEVTCKFCLRLLKYKRAA